MDNKQTIPQLYLELIEKIKAKVPEVRWMDLWRNQVNFFDNEAMFSSPAVFFAFDMINPEDMGNKVQQVTLQVSVYYFYETLASTQDGSFNQTSAIAFLDTLSRIYAALHGSSGTYYSGMRRTGQRAIDSPDNGNLYLQTFSCLLVDYAACDEFEETQIGGVIVTDEEIPVQEPDDFTIGINNYSPD